MTMIDFQTISEHPMQLGESPLWHPKEEALYWIDINGFAVHRFHPNSRAYSTWKMPSEPGCIGWCTSGGMIVAVRSGLALLDTANGSLTTLAPAPYDTTKMRFNDGRCDAAGRLWVGTLYEPRDRTIAPLYFVERGSIRDSGNRATVSNGVAFSIDDRTLYHTNTTAHRIAAYDFDISTGNIGNGRVFQQFSTDKTGNYGGRPDGAAVDSENCYWCAMYEGGRILRFSPDGDLLHEIWLPFLCPTMIAFGGEGLKTLYITSARQNRSQEELAKYPLSGHVLALSVEVPGRPEHGYIK